MRLPYQQALPERHICGQDVSSAASWNAAARASRAIADLAARRIDVAHVPAIAHHRSFQSKRP